MPRKKHNTKAPARSSKKRATKVRTDIRLSSRQETYLRAVALRDAGIYAPKKKLSGKRFTKDQAKYINRLWRKVEDHGTFLNGRTIRPFRRTLQGYKLNKPFRVVKQKTARKIMGAIPTHKGAIIDSRTAQNIRVRKDGTIVYHAKRFGKMTTIYRGKLSAKQTMAFIKQVENGEFKMPMKWGRLQVFGHETMNSSFNFTSGKGLFKEFLDRYVTALTKIARAHPDHPTLTLEFFNA